MLYTTACRRSLISSMRTAPKTLCQERESLRLEQTDGIQRTTQMRYQRRQVDANDEMCADGLLRLDRA